MFALTQSAAVAPARVVAKAPKATKAKAAFTVRAAKEESATRRAALVGLTAAAAAVVHSAQAIVIPSQASGIGIGRENGKAQASSNASMAAYTMEGTAKGGHSPKVKFGVMAEARAAAEAEAAKAAPPAPKK